MARYTIHDKNGEVKTIVHKLEMNDTFMGDNTLTLDVESAVPLHLGFGDYIDYRGERYTLRYIPNVRKQARIGSNGSAFVYSSVIFSSFREELIDCLFLDTIENDNRVPFSSLADFSFTDHHLEQVRTRLQANLNRAFGENVWQVRIADNEHLDRDNQPLKDFNYSVKDSSCWEFLAKVSQEQNVNFTIKGRIVTLGERINVSNIVLHVGKGQGLRSLEERREESEKLISVLHCYGNETNMPFRWYSARYDGRFDAESELNHLITKNLMLPGFGRVCKVGDVCYNDDVFDNVIEREYYGINTDNEVVKLPYDTLEAHTKKGSYAIVRHWKASLLPMKDAVQVREIYYNQTDNTYTFKGIKDDGIESVYPISNKSVKELLLGKEQSFLYTTNIKEDRAMSYFEHVTNNNGIELLEKRNNIVWNANNYWEWHREGKDNVENITLYKIRLASLPNSTNYVSGINKVRYHDEDVYYKITFEDTTIKASDFWHETNRTGRTHNSIKHEYGINNIYIDDNGFLWTWGLDKVERTRTPITEITFYTQGDTEVGKVTIKRNGKATPTWYDSIPQEPLTTPILKAKVKDNATIKMFIDGEKVCYVDAVWLESLSGISAYGHKEGVKYFTEDKYPYNDIYPSLKWNGGNEVISDIDNVTDNGVPDANGRISNYDFKIEIGDVGFDPRGESQAHNAVPKISMTSGACVGMSFEIAETQKTTNGYLLTCKRALSPAKDHFYPYSTGLQANGKQYNYAHILKGDTFVFIDISMPDTYIEDNVKERGASYELLRQGIRFLSEHDKNSVTPTPTLDDIFLAKDERANPIREQLKAGMTLGFKEEGLSDSYKQHFITKLTIREGFSLIPQYEVQMGKSQDTETISKSFSDVVSRVVTEQGFVNSDNTIKSGDVRYLRKDEEDTCNALVTFIKGLIIGDRQKGLGVSNEGVGVLKELLLQEGLRSVDFSKEDLQGFSLARDNNGRYKLQLDSLEVFGKAIFNVLEERKRTYMGGSSVFTCAGSTLTRVEDITIDNSLKGWRCYFYADNGTTTTQNTWQIGDMALCETFNTYGGNKRYWRKVTMVGSDYIELSKDDAEQNSDTPTIGDVVVQYGNDRSKERQGIIEIRAIGENAPEILIYAGVNQYSLKGKEKVLISPKAVRIDANLFELTATDGQTAKIEEWIRNAGKVNENLLHNTINFSDGKGWDLVNQNLYRGEVSQEVLFHGMRTLKVLLDPGIATIDDNLVYVNYDDVFTLSAWVYYVGEKPLQHKGNTPLLTVCLNNNGTAFWDFEEIAHTNIENDDIYQNGNIPKNKWVRVVRSFRVKVRDAHKMQVIIYDTSNKGTMYVGSIKLERGLQVTDNIPNFKEIEDKAVSRAEQGITLQAEKLDALTGKLKKAGIHIDSEEVSISGEKISIKDANNKDIALFKDSKVNAELIEADTLRSVSKDGAEVNIKDGLAHFTQKGTGAGVHVGVDENHIPIFYGTDAVGNELWRLGQGGLINRAEDAKIKFKDSYTLINTFDNHSYSIYKSVSLFVTNKGFKEFLFTDKDIEVRVTNRKGEWETMTCTATPIYVNATVVMEYTFNENLYSKDPISVNGYYTFQYEVWYHHEKVLSGTNERGRENMVNDLVNYFDNNRNRFNNG